MIRHTVIGLMYTRTCPLACGHCISESSPQAKGRMRLEQARRYLPAVRRFSPHLSFTGGEPLLFHRDVVTLTAEARALGLGVSVVTGAGWVKNAAMARRRVEELAAAGIGHLVISWDPYHEEFAPRENALAVARAACAAGIDVEVRSAVAPGADLEAYQAPFRHLPLRFDFTWPTKLGTARHLGDGDFHWSEDPPKGVCSAVLRAVVEPEGMVYACCGPGHFTRRPSPLALGNAEEEPLEDILARAVDDPILAAISTIGPHGLYRLLQGRDGAAVAGRRRYSSICELCLDLNGSPATVAALRARLEEQDAQILLAAAAMWMQRRAEEASTTAA
jgi:hypothetical protein